MTTWRWLARTDQGEARLLSPPHEMICKFQPVAPSDFKKTEEERAASSGTARKAVWYQLDLRPRLSPESRVNIVSFATVSFVCFKAHAMEPHVLHANWPLSFISQLWSMAASVAARHAKMLLCYQAVVTIPQAGVGCMPTRTAWTTHPSSGGTSSPLWGSLFSHLRWAAFCNIWVLGPCLGLHFHQEIWSKHTWLSQKLISSTHHRPGSCL